MYFSLGLPFSLKRYHGPEAFSEPETAAVRDFILGLNGSVKYFNNQHSYSQLILLPWGYTSDPPENSFELVRNKHISRKTFKKSALLYS